MTERQRERQSIINSLIGPIESTGESHVDGKVIENMDFAEEVILYLVDTLARNAEYKGYEKSRIDRYCGKVTGDIEEYQRNNR